MVNGVFGRVWRDFVAWHSAADDDACLDCLRLLLQGRIDYLAKPDPTLWKSGDAHDRPVRPGRSWCGLTPVLPAVPGRDGLAAPGQRHGESPAQRARPGRGDLPAGDG